MAHEFESGVFTEGKPAWHGLGVVLPARALNSAQALKFSGLGGWELSKQPVYTGNQEDGYVPYPGRYAVTRTTDRKPVGIVGESYEIVQNEEAFAWMDYLLGGEGFHYKTAGSLRGGSVVWLLAKAPFSIELPDSPIDPYVLLTNHHDRRGNIEATVTPIRVVCMNTLRAALAGATSVVKIRHTRSIRDRMGEAQKVLGLSKGAAERMRKTAQAMTRKKLSDRAFHDFLGQLVPLEADPSKAAETRVTNTRELIAEIYNSDNPHLGQRDVRGSQWGVYNAVVAYNDHAMGGRETRTSKPEESRFVRILDGTNITHRAFALLTAS